MYYNRYAKAFTPNKYDFIVGIGSKTASDDDIIEYLALEERIGTGDALAQNDIESSCGYWEALEVPENTENITQIGIHKLYAYNSDESEGIYYSLSEGWIVTVCEDGIFARGNKTPLRDFTEAILSQQRISTILEYHKRWVDKYKRMADILGFPIVN